MSNIDFKKEYKHLYKPTHQNPDVVDVPNMMFISIEGRGDPAKADYQYALQALYPVAQQIRRIIKAERDITFALMPLETLWWSNRLERFDTLDKSEWRWKAMIMQPNLVSKPIFEQALQDVSAKKKSLPRLDDVRFESFLEGLSAQILHVGSYAEQGPVVGRLHHFIEAEGYEEFGRHHEIYLSDPNKTDPDKIKTIIRQPVKYKHSM